MISTTSIISMYSNDIWCKFMFFQMHYEFNDAGLVQDCSNSNALAMELLQSCTKPS